MHISNIKGSTNRCLQVSNSRSTMLLVTLAGCLLVASHVTAQDGYRLIWEDNFDFLDPTKWDTEVTAWGGGNNEFQVYVPGEENTYIDDGKLYIKPTLLKDNTNPKTGQPFGEDFLWRGRMNLWDLYGKCTNKNNGGCYRDKGNIPPIASGKIRTKGRFSFKYGKVEYRAKMPGGDWHWPAVWMLPERYVYGGWPKSGEIDLIEIIGNQDFKYSNGRSRGQDKMGSALHWGIDSRQNKFYKTNRGTYNTTNTYAEDFHTFVVDWSENGIFFTVDGKRYLDVPYPLIDQNPGWRGFYEFGKPWRGNHNPWAGRGLMAPFDQEFHFVLNVAVGGTNGFIPDGLVNWGGMFPKPWHNRMSWRQAKDSFYRKKDDWLWTWAGDTEAMVIDYIKVYQKDF